MLTLTHEIHPAIGIARVGSSPLSTEEGYFLGPEPGVSPPAQYRDPSGYLKRQAARFRVFACWRDVEGTLIDSTEVKRDTIRQVTWTVHLVNRKGAGRRRYGSGPGYRNKAAGDEVVDQPLIIDPGPRSVTASGERRVFDSGKFRTTPVVLGEIAMEPDGRLRVLGGFGRSGSDPAQARLTLEHGHFADNNHWFDDTSDGPVTAMIQLADGTIVQSEAWVIVGPPDFAPGITNLVTLYDLLFDRAVSQGLLRAPTDLPRPVSFARHVRPILERAVNYRWVNQQTYFGFDSNGRGHGHGGPADFGAMWPRLADPSSATADLRRSIAGALRNPDRSGPQPALPPLRLSPRLSNGHALRDGAGNVLCLTRTQYEIMQAWARGEFCNDLDAPLPIDEQLPEALDRISLEGCVGAALYPGIEVNGTIVSEPTWFAKGAPFQVTRATARPGDLTQYNAVPWQADFLACAWQELEGAMPKRLAWWPAQRPDDVFTSVGSTTMVPWTRGLGTDYQDMVDKWDRLGIVADKSDTSTPFFIETERDRDVLGQ